MSAQHIATEKEFLQNALSAGMAVRAHLLKLPASDTKFMDLRSVDIDIQKVTCRLEELCKRL